MRLEGTLGDNVAYNMQSFARAMSSESPLDWFGYEEYVMFLLGLYAGRRRIFENIRAHLPVIRKLLWWGLALGVVGMAIGLAVFEEMVAFDPPFQYFTDRVGNLFYLVGLQAFSLFYASAIILLVQRETWKHRLAPLGAMGRMALTNYLLHTVIHVAIFFGVGLGLYGKVSPVAGVGVTFLMYASMTLPFS